MPETLPTEHKSLRDLSLPVRVVLAAFLISVGLGYFSAMIQLHFQHAKPGEFMPGPDEAAAAYGLGKGKQSQLVRVLTSDVSKPFNGSGSMRPAFTTQSAGWVRVLNNPKLHID